MSRYLPISVIIPAFNAERYIAASLKSVVDQTCPPFEVIIVDDGSTDSTAILAASMATKVLQQENRGVSAARNLGLLEASQQWVAFLDADDVWKEDKLACQWEAIMACPGAGLIFSDFETFNDKGIIRTSQLSCLPHYKAIVKYPVIDRAFRCDINSLQTEFQRGNFINTSTVLVRRDILRLVGLFDEELSSCEDRELWLRLFTSCETIVIERPLVLTRDLFPSLSSDAYKAASSIALIADKVVCNPERYPKAAVDYYRKERPALYLNAGRFAEAKRDIKRAQQYYLHAWRLGAGMRALAHVIMLGFVAAYLYVCGKLDRFSKRARS